MTFGERLTELRMANGYSKRNDFADKLGIPSTTLRNYETDVREPGHTFLKQISELFNVSVDYLLCLTNEKEVLNSFRLKISEFDHIKKYRDLDDHGRESIDIILDRESQRVETLREMQAQLSSQTEISSNNKLYLYTYLRKIACAGTGFYFDDIPTDVIEAPFMHGTDFIIGVNGDSMEPDYYDGELLYVQKVHELTLGDTGIFMYRNEFFVKELGDKGLISKNTDYEEIEGTEEIRLIGRVLGKVEER